METAFPRRPKPFGPRPMQLGMGAPLVALSMLPLDAADTSPRCTHLGITADSARRILERKHRITHLSGLIWAKRGLSNIA